MSWHFASIAYAAFAFFCLWFDFVLAGKCAHSLIDIKQKYLKEEDERVKLSLITEELKWIVLFSLQHAVLMFSPPIIARLVIQNYGISAVFINTVSLSALVIIPCAFIFWGYAFLYPQWRVYKEAAN